MKFIIIFRINFPKLPYKYKKYRMLMFKETQILKFKYSN